MATILKIVEQTEMLHLHIKWPPYCISGLDPISDLSDTANFCQRFEYVQPVPNIDLLPGSSFVGFPFKIVVSVDEYRSAT